MLFLFCSMVAISSFLAVVVAVKTAIMLKQGHGSSTFQTALFAISVGITTYVGINLFA